MRQFNYSAFPKSFGESLVMKIFEIIFAVGTAKSILCSDRSKAGKLIPISKQKDQKQYASKDSSKYHSS